jgi:transketolase
VAVGVALAARLDGSPRRTFVLCGDGELQEGSMWEAAMAAGHHGLDQLVLIVDRNRLQQGDATERTMRLDPLADRFTAFGWSVREVDGHDHAALLDMFGAIPFERGRPSCLIAHTHKGRGVSFMEDQVAWHHRIPTPSEYERARTELEARLAGLEATVPEPAP